MECTFEFGTSGARAYQSTKCVQGRKQRNRAQFVHLGEVTNSDNSGPNASNPNGPAIRRGASPTRILGAPTRSAVAS